MILNGLFDPLWLDANVTLCGGGTAVLQEPLDKGDVIAVRLVDLRCVPFTKAVSADALIAEIVTDNGKLLLHGSGCDGKEQVIFSDVVSQTVILDILGDDHGNGEDALLAGLLLGDL